MRHLDLTVRFRRELRELPRGGREQEAVLSVPRELADLRAPLPHPDDRTIAIPQSVVGRAVPGTDLVVAYRPGVTFVPGIEEVPIFALIRARRR
jgi:hypothetical protein